MWFLKDMVKLGKLIIQSFVITFITLVFVGMVVKFFNNIYLNM